MIEIIRRLCNSEVSKGRFHYLTQYATNNSIVVPMPLEEVDIERASNFLRVKLPELDGEYELTCSITLVQAVGTAGGIKFGFYAKHGEWAFESEDERGHPYPNGHWGRFSMKDRYDESKSGAMELEWASRLMRHCLATWWMTDG